MLKAFFPFFLSIAPAIGFAYVPGEGVFCDQILKKAEKEFYPNFTDNPSLSSSMKGHMEPYLLPLNHKMKNVLDKLFSSDKVTESEKSLRKAGFKILFSQKRSLIRVITHPKLRGYLIKLFPNSEKSQLESGWKRLTTRCFVAEKIKLIIQKEGIRHFIVADKWLYPLPISQSSEKGQPVVLLVKDMHIYNRHDTKKAWKKRATKKILKELMLILGRGYGSAFLPGNIPYTKCGKFAFIDTEYDKRKIPLQHVTRCLSHSKRTYWNRLIKHSL